MTKLNTCMRAMRFFGLTPDMGKNHAIKAMLESLAYQTKDILNAIQE